jgi:hypothetical protein
MTSAMRPELRRRIRAAFITMRVSQVASEEPRA